MVALTGKTPDFCTCAGFTKWSLMAFHHYCWLTFILSVSLAGCSSTTNSGKYFDHDGPPSSLSSWRASSSGSVKIKVEPANKYANRPYRVMGQSFRPMTGDKPFTQTGTASWYGKQFHGKKTAIGDIYNMYAMTAAHPTMELPSYAKVTNLSNGRSVIVRVNDRGPFIGGRAIDMSYAAAVKLGYQNKGTTKVRIERITRVQIARGDIPSATHTDVTLASALAANEAESTKKNTKVASSTTRNYDVRTTTATPYVATATSQSTTPASAKAEIEAEAKRIQDTIASYVPTQAETPPSTEPVVAEDPLASLVASVENTPVLVAQTVSINDASYESVFPKEGEVTVTPTATEADGLKELDSAHVAWGAQIGAFENKANAQAFAAHTEMMLTTEGIMDPVRIVQSSERWCVLVGDSSQERAIEIARTISDRLGTSVFATFK